MADKLRNYYKFTISKWQQARTTEIVSGQTYGIMKMLAVFIQKERLALAPPYLYYFNLIRPKIQTAALYGNLLNII
jgi:hypothetical protein